MKPFQKRHLFTLLFMLLSSVTFGSTNANKFPFHKGAEFSANNSLEDLRLSKRIKKGKRYGIKSRKSNKGSFKNTLEAVLEVFLIPYSIIFGFFGFFALLFGKSITIWQLLLLSLGTYVSIMLIVGTVFFIGYHSSGRKPKPVAS